MTYLLDTHALLFWLIQPEALGPEARRVLCDRDARVLWSVVGTWEVLIKCSTGKLRLPGPPEVELPAALARAGLEVLSVDHAHVLHVASLPPVHKDPFDRMLIAQALVEGATFVTNDGMAERYGVPVVW